MKKTTDELVRDIHRVPMTKSKTRRLIEEAFTTKTKLAHCTTCIQMTNHNDTTCLKCVTPPNDVEEWEKEFAKRIPKTDDKLLESNQESEQYEFGYKFMREGSNEIHCVTDFSNIQKFIRTLLIAEKRKMVEEILEDIKPEIKALQNYQFDVEDSIKAIATRHGISR